MTFAVSLFAACVAGYIMKAVEQHQVNFADCYVLAKERTKAFIHAFLDTFLPNRYETASQYEVPQFSEVPALVFNTADELITYLEQQPNERHAIYWVNNDAATLRGAMCIFTSDGQVIVGLYCETLRPDATIETAYLRQLLAFCNSTKGLIEYEQPAPQDTAAFLERLNART